MSLYRARRVFPPRLTLASPALRTERASACTSAWGCSLLWPHCTVQAHEQKHAKSAHARSCSRLASRSQRSFAPQTLRHVTCALLPLRSGVAARLRCCQHASAMLRGGASRTLVPAGRHAGTPARIFANPTCDGLDSGESDPPVATPTVYRFVRVRERYAAAESGRARPPTNAHATKSYTTTRLTHRRSSAHRRGRRHEAELCDAR